MWIKDSGAKNHLTGNSKSLTNLRSLDVPTLKESGDLTKLQGIALGDVHIDAHDGTKWYPIVLKDILYSPELTFNLFSRTIVLDKGFSQQATAQLSIIPEDNKPVLEFRPKKKLLSVISSISQTLAREIGTSKYSLCQGHTEEK